MTNDTRVTLSNSAGPYWSGTFAEYAKSVHPEEAKRAGTYLKACGVYTNSNDITVAIETDRDEDRQLKIERNLLMDAVTSQDEQIQQLKANKASIVPCKCGHPQAYWYGERDGLREYSCANCHHIRQAIRYLKSDYIQRNKHRLGVLGQKDLDLALGILES